MKQLDPEPYWEEQLNPDPQKINMDPVHWICCYELPGLRSGQVLEQQAEDDRIKAASCQWRHRPSLVGKKMADNDCAQKMTAWKLPLFSDVTDPTAWVKK